MNWYLRALERHLTENKMAQRGPYVIGQKFTYVDMVTSVPLSWRWPDANGVRRFQVLHDEELGKGGYEKN
jgi:glutathione S-transferase